METFFHVTISKNQESIKKKGLIFTGKTNWINAFGGNLTAKNHIYAFTLFDDAVRWAFKMQFELQKTVLVVEFQDDAPWKEDTHWEAQMAKGKWVMKAGPVAATQIMDFISITPEMCKAVVKTLGENKQLLKTGKIVAFRKPCPYE